MKHIKRFNEDIDTDMDMDETEPTPIRVKDIVAYLQTLDQEAEVHLDKDGWDYMYTPKETIENSYLFSYSEWKGVNYLTINN